MKISVVLLMISFLTHFSTAAQHNIAATDSFKIQGKIKSEKIFTLMQLDSFPKQALKDQMIYNHNGEIKDTIKNTKGVLLKTVLSKIEFLYDKPKELNEFYFVFVASDGYKIVFSWNEIYNTPVGDDLFLITESDGKKLKDIAQRIIVTSMGDLKSGRRFIKGLARIEVKRIE